MTDKILEGVRESVFKKYNNLPEITKQPVKGNARDRVEQELNNLANRIDNALILTEREQSLLILSIDEDDPDYEYVRVLTEAISMVGDLLIPLENLIDKLEK
jgi:hypothetical protein